MSKGKRTSAALTTAALVFTATACGTGSTDSTSGDKIELGLAISSLNNPFFVEMKKGAEAEAKSQGVELSVQDAQDDASRQVNQVQNFTSQNMKSVIINPVDSEAAAPAVKAASNADIPVLAADRSINSGDVKATVASDNVEGGRLAAKQLAEELDEQGEILVLRGQSGTSASRERGKGFAEGIKKYPGIKVVAKQPADFDRAKGLDVTTNALQSHPNITGVFAENDEMALGAVKALKGDAGTKVKVIGFDGTPEGLKAIAGGKLTCSIAQQPDELGRMAVRNAVRLANDNDVDKQIKVPVKVVTQKNVDRFS
ncbi:D-ribose ABC transporter substrate-binding protein [Streptomyces sp. HNM0574]|nr:D-ribose ABC transporter substrate-binding protein [Streptomyces sp. HNM0574]